MQVVAAHIMRTCWWLTATMGGSLFMYMVSAFPHTLL